MGKIIFYEDQNYGGRHYECSGDCTDMHCLLSQCNSIKVLSGYFMIYEKPNYTGHQYFLCPGEYPEYHKWMGINDNINSCHVISPVPGSHDMCLFERIEYGGQRMNLVEDCPSVHDRFHVHNIFSCNVKGGYWLFYEDPNYQGRMYLLRPGDYRRFSEWGGRSARVGSIRRIMELIN